MQFQGILTMDYKFWVYIMSSRSGTLYIGMTNDIDKRVEDHKLKLIEGFSSKYNCTRLVYYESFDDVRNAIDREKQLKGWRRSKKVALIESIHPKWQDLSEKWGSEMLFSQQAMKGTR